METGQHKEEKQSKEREIKAMERRQEKGNNVGLWWALLCLYNVDVLCSLRYLLALVIVSAVPDCIGELVGMPHRRTQCLSWYQNKVYTWL